MIDIKDIQGSIIYSTAINKGAKRKFQLMSEDYIVLPFNLDEPVTFGLGAYVETSEGRFEVTDLQKPTLNTFNGGYDYQLKLEAYYYKWKNKIFKFTPENGGQEASWSLTASLDVHLGIFLRNLSALGYTYNGTPFMFSIDSTVEAKSVAITYDNTNMIDALSTMAEAWECEWWVTDHVINFGRCEYGTPVDFILGENVAEMTRSDSKTEYATRLFVFGSTQNLPSEYRPVDESLVVNGVVQQRLMLPEGIPYIDAYENMAEEEAIEQVVIIEDIYPKFIGSISSVTTYTDTVENEDGTTNTETFYRFKDSGFTFSEEYLLEGSELKAVFQSGLLNGMEFGIRFNPNNAAEKNEDGTWNTEAQLFEIVASEDYGRKLPDETLYPKAGDSYILTGWDSAKIADLGLVEKAEQELYQKGLQISAKRKIDPNTYNCKMFPDYIYGVDVNGDLNSNESKKFSAGDRVRLVNPTYFKDGRESRIIGFEYPLDLKYDNPIYIVGETASYSRLGELEDKLDAITYKGQTYTGGSGDSGVYVIGTNDATPATDRNVYSALRSEKMFLRKDRADRTPYNLGVGGTLTVDKGAVIKGTTETDDVIVNEGIHSKEFISGFTGGKGWAIKFKDYLNSAGVTEQRAVAEFDDLIVRGVLRVFEFVVSQMLGENDNRTFTGMMEVDHYDPETGKVWLDTQDGKLYNTFRKDDIILVQQYNGMPSEENDYYITKQYELIIDEVGVGDASLGEDRLDWVTFRNFSSPMEGVMADIITKGDTFVRIDNLTDPTRKGIIQIMTVGEDTPYMDVIYGKKTDPDNALKSRFGNLQGIYNHLFGWLQDFGAYIANLYAVGEFRIAHTGEDVADKIEMVKGAFRTNFSQSYFDMSDETNYIKNGSFSGELEGWELGESSVEFLTIDGSAIYANRNIMTANQKFAGKAVYNDKDMLRILNSDVKQLNTYIKQPGTHKEYVAMDGSEEEPSYEYKDVKDKLYLYMRVFCNGDGTLEVGFEGNTSEDDSIPFITRELTKGVDEIQITSEGTWDGTGDFVIRTTGDVYIEFVSLTDKPIENLMTTTQTWMEQDAGRIALLGQKINENAGSITDLGIELDATNEQLLLYVNKTDANTTSISQLQIDVDGISTTVASVKSTAEDAEYLANTAITNARNALYTAQDAADDASTAKANAATAITQSSNAIDILAVNFDDEGNLLATSGIKVYVDDAVSNIKITADNVDINNGVVVIDSTSAKIGHFIVDTKGLYMDTTNNDAYINFGWTGTKFIRMNVSGDDALFKGRHDAGAIMHLEAYGPSATALTLLGNTSGNGYGYALKSIGNTYLIARNADEGVVIGGLAVTAAYGNSFKNPYNAFVTVDTSWVDFLVMTGNTTLPDPDDCPFGKILFVKCASTYTLTVPSCILADDTSPATRTWKDNHMRAFISTGSRWYEMYLT